MQVPLLRILEKYQPREEISRRLDNEQVRPFEPGEDLLSTPPEALADYGLLFVVIFSVLAFLGVWFFNILLP